VLLNKEADRTLSHSPLNCEQMVTKLAWYLILWTLSVTL